MLASWGGCLETEEVLVDGLVFGCELVEDLLVEFLGAEFLLDPLDPEAADCGGCWDWLVRGEELLPGVLVGLLWRKNTAQTSPAKPITTKSTTARRTNDILRGLS